MTLDKKSDLLGEMTPDENTVLDDAFWEEVVVTYSDAMYAHAGRLCARFGVPTSFAESAVHEALIAAMTRVEIKGGPLGAAKLIFCIVRRQVVNEWRRKRRFDTLSDGDEDRAAGTNRADLHQRLEDVGWDTAAKDAETELAAASARRRETKEDRAVELGWTLLPAHAPGDRAQVARHMFTLQRLVEGVSYPVIASDLGLDPTDKKALQRLRSWKRRGGQHLRGWVHALVGTQPSRPGDTRQVHGFWKVGRDAGGTYLETQSSEQNND